MVVGGVSKRSKRICLHHHQQLLLLLLLKGEVYLKNERKMERYGILILPKMEKKTHTHTHLLTKAVMILSIPTASAVCVRSASQWRMAFDKLQMSEECLLSTCKKQTYFITIRTWMHKVSISITSIVRQRSYSGWNATWQPRWLQRRLQTGKKEAI